MKKIIILIATVFLLVSCGQTQEEKIQTKKDCAEIGYDTLIDAFGGVRCSSYRKIGNEVMKCIKEYTNGIDEKYNNPDHVTNLREDEYSNVVRTCNEIFGDKEAIDTK